MVQVSEALVHMHSRMRCAHMDLKPENILIFRRVADGGGEGGEGSGDWVAKIADFGAAQSLRATEPLHVTEYTVPYAAPEQLSGRLRSHLEGFACDVYAFGCVLFEVLTGGRLKGLNGDGPLDRDRIRGAEVTHRWRSLEQNVREKLLDLCAACTATEATQRPSAQSARDALTQLGAQLGARGTSDCDKKGHIVLRNSYLLQLRASLAAHPVAVLHGPPGMGKSVLARQYSESDGLADYIHVLEASGNSAAATVEDLYDAVNLTLLPLLQPHGSVAAPDFKSAEGVTLAAVRALTHWLRRVREQLGDIRPFLIILDGLDDVAGLDGVLEELKREPSAAAGALEHRSLAAVLVTTIAPPPSLPTEAGVNWIAVGGFGDDDVRCLLWQAAVQDAGDDGRAALEALRMATGMRPWAVARLVSIAACTGRSLLLEAKTLVHDGAIIQDAVDADIRRRCREAIRGHLQYLPEALKLYDDAMTFCSCSATLGLSPTVLRAVQLGHDQSPRPLQRPEGQRDACNVARIAKVLSDVTTSAAGSSLHRLDLDDSTCVFGADQREALGKLRRMFVTLVHWAELCGSHRPVIPALVNLTSALCGAGGDGAFDAVDMDDIVVAAADVLSGASDLGSSSAGVCVTFAQLAMKLSTHSRHPLNMANSLSVFGVRGMHAGSDAEGRDTLLKAQRASLAILRLLYAGVDHPDLAPLSLSRSLTTSLDSGAARHSTCSGGCTRAWTTRTLPRRSTTSACRCCRWVSARPA